MKNIYKKIISVLLACALLLCFVPAVSVSAAGYSNGYVGTYKGDGKGIYAHGIDISKWQEKKINFTQLKAGGIKFVIIRAGYSTTTDPYFEYNYKAAKAAGLDVGVYWYSYATTSSGATSEVNACSKLLSGKKFEYPIYFDFEDETQMGLSTATKKSICRTWLNAMAGKGYLVGLYSMYSQFNGALKPADICPEYETWVARYLNSGSYSSYADYHSKYGMWQYTEKGSVSGYSGKLDKNVCFKDYPSIVKKYGFNGYSAVKEFTFEFDANGGSGTMANQKIKYGTDTAISANKFTKEGYEFVGWTARRLEDNTYRYTNGTDTGWYAKGSQPAGYYYYLYKDKVTVSKTGLGSGDTVRLTAVWGRANYKVHFDANGGTGTMSDMSCRNGVNKTFTANAFSKSGSTFAGWYLSRKSDGKMLYTNNASSTNAWYTPGAQPTGYRLSLYENQRTFSALSNSEGDVVTCTAQWKPNATGTQSYYLDFNANGGTGTMDRQQIIYGTSTPTTKNAFTKYGYKFVGWAAHRRANDKWLCEDSSGTTSWQLASNMGTAYTLSLYNNGSAIAKTTSTDCDIVTFYAIWEKCNMGDVNLDGTVSVLDATELQKGIANIIELTEEQKAVADVTFDGKITIKDATQIQRFCAGCIKDFATPSLPDIGDPEPTEPTDPTIPEEPTDPAPAVEYFPACSSSQTTLAAALQSVGAESTFAYRETIAAANNITNYTGTAEQNTQMLNLLKQGKLIKPGSQTAIKFFPACDSSYTTISAALQSIGVESTLTYRRIIAEANNFTDYSGTPEQNTQMLNLLKQGKLIMP